MDLIEQNLERGEELFVKALGQGKGVTGYSYHTVPTVLFIWLRNQNNYEVAMESMIRLGGDTDTTSAILGGVLGANVGRAGIPTDWLNEIADWPLTVRYVATMAERLVQCKQTGKRQAIGLLPGPIIFIRNMLFLIIVLLHGFRRLLPPY